ncbi:Homeobox-leucine zipper protein HOX29 [Capsicum baccatum]|uniref:Homeobox-leucine zipper protein HOX29 n=1 Tax=Capsicum baccatum TaxID=33114 RepID=A0A2G2VTG6_CAPBA|nr:Homeobox-leucine zipper protein HOX29 [Capsicum baccatum]
MGEFIAEWYKPGSWFAQLLCLKKEVSWAKTKSNISMNEFTSEDRIYFHIICNQVSACTNMKEVAELCAWIVACTLDSIPLDVGQLVVNEIDYFNIQDSIGSIAISHGCIAVAARACGLVGLEPTRVSKIIKDRRLWFCDCRIVSVINVLPNVNGGTIEPLYIQLNAPTTWAPACDFWLLWYTTVTDDGSLMLCSGMDENLFATHTELVYAPIDASFHDDALLLLSGFCIISLESGKVNICILTLSSYSFGFFSQMQESVASMAQQYVRSIISPVQRVALALSPSHLGSHGGSIATGDNRCYSSVEPSQQEVNKTVAIGRSMATVGITITETIAICLSQRSHIGRLPNYYGSSMAMVFMSIAMIFELLL